MSDPVFSFGESINKTWLIITSEGKYIVTIPAINTLGVLLIILGVCCVGIGTYLYILTSTGIK